MDAIHKLAQEVNWFAFSFDAFLAKTPVSDDALTLKDHFDEFDQWYSRYHRAFWVTECDYPDHPDAEYIVRQRGEARAFALASPNRITIGEFAADSFHELLDRVSGSIVDKQLRIVAEALGFKLIFEDEGSPRFYRWELPDGSTRPFDALTSPEFEQKIASKLTDATRDRHEADLRKLLRVLDSILPNLSKEYLHTCARLVECPKLLSMFDGSMPEPRSLIRVTELARQWGVTPRTIRKMIRDGRLEGNLVGGGYARVVPSDIPAILD